jgi:hypothetical protein
LKISREFAARLEARESDEVVRAIVILETAPAARGTGRRALRTRRKKLTESMQRSVEAAADEIAEILEKYGGHRLERQIGTLGGLAVETTPAGIKALSECPRVRVILEDQSVSLISK